MTSTTTPDQYLTVIQQKVEKETNAAIGNGCS